MPDQNEPVTLGAPITAAPADQSGQASPAPTAPQASGQSPEAAEPVTLGAPITAAPEEGMASKALHNVESFAGGMGKGNILQPIASVSNLIHKIPGGVGEALVPQSGLNAENENAKYENNVERAGGISGQILSMLIPVGAAAKGVTSASEGVLQAGNVMKALESSPQAMKVFLAGMHVLKGAGTAGVLAGAQSGLEAAGNAAQSGQSLGSSLLTGAEEGLKTGAETAVTGAALGAAAKGAVKGASFLFNHTDPLARAFRSYGLTDSIAKSVTPLIKNAVAKSGAEINSAEDAIKSINLAKQELMTRAATTDAQKIALNDHIGALNTTKNAIEKAQEATATAGKVKAPSNSPVAKAGQIAQELPVAGHNVIKPLKNIYNILKRPDTAEQLDARISKAFSANTPLDHPVLDKILPPGPGPETSANVKVPAGKVVPKQATPEVAPKITPFNPENPTTSANVQVPAGPRVPQFGAAETPATPVTPSGPITSANVQVPAGPRAQTLSTPAAEPVSPVQTPGPVTSANVEVPTGPRIPKYNTVELTKKAEPIRGELEFPKEEAPKAEVKVAAPEVAKEVFEKETPTKAKGVLEPQPWKEYKGPTDGDNASLQALTHYSDSDLTDIANSEKFKERGLDISNIDNKDPLYSEKVIQQIHDHLTDDEMEAFGKEARTQEAGRNNPDSLTHVVKHPANQPVAQHLQDMADAIKDKNIGAEGIRDRIALQNASHAVSRYPEDVTGMTAKQLQNKIKGVGDTTAGHMRDFLDKNTPEAETAPVAEKATEVAPKAEVAAPKTSEVAPKATITPKAAKVVANPVTKKPAKDLYAGLADNLSGINKELTKPGRLSRGATETLQAMKQKVEAKNADRILMALNKTQDQEGLVTGVSKVRNELPDMSKEDFDKGVHSLIEQKKVFAHDHGSPFSLSEQERNKLVHIPEYGKSNPNHEGYYVGIAKRPKE